MIASSSFVTILRKRLPLAGPCSVNLYERDVFLSVSGGGDNPVKLYSIGNICWKFKLHREGGNIYFS